MKIMLTSVFLVLMAMLTSAQPCRTVIGYYPGWQWYDRAGLVGPSTILYDRYSIINYAFLVPQADGSINISDPWGDKNLLLGQFDWSVSPVGYDTSYDLGNPDYHHTETSLVAKAHAAGTQVAISIGGWTLSGLFPSIAADPVKRTQFAHSCCDVIRTYDADGIDLDWEYPGYAEHNGTPNDISNFSLLVAEIRDSLNALEVLTGDELLLSSAFGASAVNMSNIEWDVMVAELDYINLMTYDFSGTFDTNANHHTPLFAAAQGSPDNCIDAAVSRLMNEYNVPPSKIVIGAAFYGKSMITSGTPDLFAPITGASDFATFPNDEGQPMYYNIINQMDLFNEHWDDQAKAPYLTGIGNLHTFVTYDDETSLEAKGQYVVDNNLAGMIIWEITGDYFETTPGSGIIGSTPLADALNDALCSSISVPLDCANMCVTDIAMNIEPGLLDVTIQNGSSQINYPVVMVVVNGDTVANINEEFFFFAQLPGQSVVHTISTSLTDIPQGFTCQVIIGDEIYDEECILNYPCLPENVNHEDESAFELFPNPVRHVLNVQLPNVRENWTVCNLQGQVLFSEKILNSYGQINIEGFAPGVYFLSCSNDLNEPLVYRFVVE